MPESPFGVARMLLRSSRAMGSITFNYHFAPAYTSLSSSPVHLFFPDKAAFTAAFANEAVDMDLTKVIGKAHDYVLSKGRPATLVEIIEELSGQYQREITSIVDNVRKFGLRDEYMIPVYGPNKIEACICYGFDVPISELPKPMLNELEAISMMGHRRLVHYFNKRGEQTPLSRRESEVLHWMAQGKSSSVIATIMDIRPATVDSYTRRLFGKFGVHDRIAAVLAGMAAGMVRLD